MIASDGGKHLLHLAVGNKESEACWTDFFRSLKARGLSGVQLVVSDSHAGLVPAIRLEGPDQCWYLTLVAFALP